MRALVTGSQGFTGRYLCNELRRRGHVVAPLTADVMDRMALTAAIAESAPHIIVHLAAIAFVGGEDFEAFYCVNQLGTFNLLAAAAAAAPDARILLASSANIYGNQTGGLLNEDTPPNPANHYAVSKWAMELGARQWSDKLNITMVRPFNYTGVGQGEQYLIPKIVAHFKRRDSLIELGNLDVMRDFGDVRSVVAAYADLAVCADAAGETYNISTGETHNLGAIVEMASQITGHQLDIRVNPRFVRANEVRVLAGDPAKLRSVLPEWKVFPLFETLSWMLNSDF